MVFPADILPKGPNIYSCADIFLPANSEDGKAGQVDNALSITAFFLDLDNAPSEPVISAPIRLHIVVESSLGRYQSFWKIEPIPVADGNRLSAKTRFERVQSGLARRFGGDHIIDLPRVMRYPFAFPESCRSMESPNTARRIYRNLPN